MFSMTISNTYLHDYIDPFLFLHVCDYDNLSVYCCLTSACLTFACLHVHFFHYLQQPHRDIMFVQFHFNSENIIFSGIVSLYVTFLELVCD